MKKIILLFLIVFSLLSKYSYAEPTVSPKDPDISGPVKSISTYDENNTLRRDVKYDRQGHVTSMIKYDSRGNLYEKDLYEKDLYEYDYSGIKIKYRNKYPSGGRTITYDKNGNLLELVYDRDDGPKRYVHKYNEKGEELEETAYLKDGSIWEHSKYIYKGGKKLEKITKRRDKSLPKKIIYEYDSRGNTSRITYSWYHGHISSIWKYEFDEKGNKVKWEKHSFHEGESRGKDVYIYDHKGNTVQRKSITADGVLLGKREYTYNNLNNIIEERGYESNELRVIWKYSNDNKGNLVEFIEYLGPESKGIINQHDKYEYLFDKEGNWIKRTLKNDGLLKPEIWIRSITYWD